MSYREFCIQLERIDARKARITERLDEATKALNKTMTSLMEARHDAFNELDRILKLEGTDDFTFAWGGSKYTIRHNAGAYTVILLDNEQQGVKGDQATASAVCCSEWKTFKTFDELARARAICDEIRKFVKISGNAVSLYINKLESLLRKQEDVIDLVTGRETDPYF